MIFNAYILIAKLPIILPPLQLPSLGPYAPKLPRFLAVPSTHAIITHLDKHHPPTVTVTTKGIQEFPQLLEMLSQLGRYYGGLKLKLPPLETGKPWFHVPSNRPLSTIQLVGRKQVFEEMKSNDIHGNKAYRVASKSFKQPMSLWSTHMVKKREYGDIGALNTFWEEVGKEVVRNEGSKSRFYGTDVESKSLYYV